MKWQNVGDMPCSVARTLSIVGDRWTLLLLRTAFLGTRRFDDFQSMLGMTRHVLAERLKRLVACDILQKVAYHDRQERFEYRLTEKGRELYPVIMSLTSWGDKWMDEGRGPPLLYQHKACGKQMTPVMVCPDCGEPVTARDIVPIAGPGLHAPAQQTSE